MGQRGHSEARGDAQRAPSVGQRQRERLDALTHALGQVEGALEVGAGQHHRELLAAVAGGRVDVARALAQDASDLAQHDVALLMAVGVVDALEVVDVEHD